MWPISSGEQRVFEIAQSRAAEFVVLMRRRRHEHVPEALGAAPSSSGPPGSGSPSSAGPRRPAACRSAPPGRTCLVMNDCTRLEPFFLLSDMLKSMGRSSAFGFRILGPHCPPAAPCAARAISLVAGVMTKAVTAPETPPAKSRGLTFPALQTIVSYKCLNCNCSVIRGAHARRDPGRLSDHAERSDPVRHPRRRRAALCRPRLRRRHAARHRGGGRTSISRR